MKLNRFFAALLALLIIGSAFISVSAAEPVPAEIDSARVFEKMKPDSLGTIAGKLNYCYYRSPSFNPVNTQTPAALIIYLHNGGKGEDNASHLAERSFLNQLVSDDSDKIFSDHPYMVVAPQCPEGRSWTDAEMTQAVDQLREEITFSKGVFTDKCIIMGVGAGADGVFGYLSTYAACVDRAVTVGGSPEKTTVTRAVSSGVSLLSFAETTNTAFNEFYDYAERMGEADFITPVRVEGGVEACLDRALRYNEPSVAAWCISDYMTSRYFRISANCDVGAKISVSPSPVKYGGNASVLLTTEKGYTVSRFVIDGNDVSLNLLEQSSGNKNQYTYTFVGVTEDHSVMVELQRVPEDGDMSGFIAGLMKGLSIASVVLILAAAAVWALGFIKKED